MYIKINQYLKTVNEWNMLNKLLKKCFYSIFNSYTLIDIRTNDRLNATEFKKKILDKQWLRDNYYHLFWQCSKEITKMSYWRKKIKIFYFSLFFLEGRGGGARKSTMFVNLHNAHMLTIITLNKRYDYISNCLKLRYFFLLGYILYM